jgi:hypothetical protein
MYLKIQFKYKNKKRVNKYEHVTGIKISYYKLFWSVMIPGIINMVEYKMRG